jgi:sulfate adenylyltransferase subunit 1 (EFTu-like GTPase family)
MRPGGRYIVQQSAYRTLGRIATVHSRLDIDTQQETQLLGGTVNANDIVRAELTLQSPLFVDPYDVVRATGALILIDEATNHTVAAGLVQ